MKVGTAGRSSEKKGSLPRVRRILKGCFSPCVSHGVSSGRDDGGADVPQRETLQTKTTLKKAPPKKNRRVFVLVVPNMTLTHTNTGTHKHRDGKCGKAAVLQHVAAC